MTLKTRPFDVAEYLETDEDIHLFLQAAFEEGNEEEFVHALATAACGDQKIISKYFERLAAHLQWKELYLTMTEFSQGKVKIKPKRQDELVFPTNKILVQGGNISYSVQQFCPKVESPV